MNKIYEKRKQYNYVQIAINSTILLLSVVVLLPICSISSLKIKAVNLGGWLVTEGGVTPFLFDGIPNNDFLVCTYGCINELIDCPFFTLIKASPMASLKPILEHQHLKNPLQ